MVSTPYGAEGNARASHCTRNILEVLTASQGANEYEMAIMILALALIGHGFLWVALINMTHAVRIPQWLCAMLSAAMFFLGGAIPLGFAAA